MSSRSLGLLAGSFVSHGKSQPASCFLIRSGSSVRKRMRPCRRTLSGRFWIGRSSNELLTLARYEKAPTTRVTENHRENPSSASLYIVLLGDPLLRILNGAGELFQTAAGEDLLEFVEQRIMHQAVRSQARAAG